MKGLDWVEYRSKVREMVERNFEETAPAFLPKLEDPLNIEIWEDVIFNADCLIDCVPESIAEEMALKETLNSLLLSIMLRLVRYEVNDKKISSTED